MKVFMKTAFMVPLALSLALALTVSWIPQVAQASFITVGFQKVTNNNVEDLSGQLGLRIYDAMQANSTFSLALVGNQVLFAYTNNVGIASNISEVYIDDGNVLSLNAVHNSLGGFTSFTGGGASPGNLPGGNLLVPPFVATSSFSADVDPGPPGNGVNQAADILGVSYNTSSGLAGITSVIGDGNLRVGLHVRSIGVAGGSDSYFNTGGPTTVIPEPSTMLLLGSGLVGLGLIRRRRKSS